MKRVSVTNLNARTIDIINVIRKNASISYQNEVPEIATSTDIPRVGEIICGYPAFANEFLSALMNRIALVQIRSATFNNPFERLKKGYLEFGETVEEVFINIAKAREFSAEKAEKREFKRTLPDVRSAFHTMNWIVQYPITIQDIDLRTAFKTENGVTDMIAKIVNSVYTANNYDEYLLFKYLLIKGITNGAFYPVSIGDGTNMDDSAVAFRGMSNQLTFISTNYNASHVTTNTLKPNQYIFMDSMFNAKFDVEVLARAFNMEKADFIGRLILIDDWTSFDNDRFDVIRESSTMIDEITSNELAIMNDVKAVIVDDEYFQVYDNLLMMTEKYVASGLYWNYFLNVRKTVSYSPFSNAIVFVTDDATLTTPETITLTVTAKSVNDGSTVITLENVGADSALTGIIPHFVQTLTATQNGVAVHKYGAYIFTSNATECDVECVVNGDTYKASENMETSVEVGDTITVTKE